MPAEFTFITLVDLASRAVVLGPLSITRSSTTTRKGMASQRKLKDLRKMEETRDGTSSWDELKLCLLEDGWCEPAREFDLDGQNLVGERIYVMVRTCFHGPHKRPARIQKTSGAMGRGTDQAS